MPCNNILQLAFHLHFYKFVKKNVYVIHIFYTQNAILKKLSADTFLWHNSRILLTNCQLTNFSVIQLTQNQFVTVFIIHVLKSQKKKLISQILSHIKCIWIKRKRDQSAYRFDRHGYCWCLHNHYILYNYCQTIHVFPHIVHQVKKICTCS